MKLSATHFMLILLTFIHFKQTRTAFIDSSKSFYHVKKFSSISIFSHRNLVEMVSNMISPQLIFVVYDDKEFQNLLFFAYDSLYVFLICFNWIYRTMYRSLRWDKMSNEIYYQLKMITPLAESESSQLTLWPLLIWISIIMERRSVVKSYELNSLWVNCSELCYVDGPIYLNLAVIRYK